MNSYPIGWRRMESRMKKLTIFTLLYWKYIIHFVLLNWKYVRNIFTIRAPYWHWYEKSFSMWRSGSPSLEGQSDGPLSPSDIHPSSNPKQLMLSGVSLLAFSNVNNPVGLVGLPYVMWSAHFSVTRIQTEKISSCNGQTFHVCCFMLACSSTKIFVSRVQKTAKKSSLAEKFVSKVTR
jgi:hypothetical protein